MTTNGLYGKYAYIADGGEKNLILPSLYVLLWMNFATFGMAHFIGLNRFLFVFDNPEQFSERCSKRLRNLWKQMTLNLDFCDEDVSYLFARCLSGVLKVPIVIIKNKYCSHMFTVRPILI